MKEFKSPLNYMWQNMSQRVFDFIRGSRKFVTLPVPENDGDTIELYVSAPETIVKFAGPIAHAFNLKTICPKAKLGDKLYLIINAIPNDDFVISSTGNLIFNTCGPETNQANEYDVISPNNVIIPLLFDGTNFVGQDYC